MSANARVDLDAVPVLPGVDVESLVQLVAVVEDSKIDLLGVAGIDLYRTVVGVHADLGTARYAVGLGPFLRLGAWRERGRG